MAIKYISYMHRKLFFLIHILHTRQHFDDDVGGVIL
jgi:hypothetical protein